MVKVKRSLLRAAEGFFEATFDLYGTEDRVLIYGAADGRQVLLRPDLDLGPTHAECDVDLVLEHDGQEWDLIADLHSHHVMGARFSPQDDQAERLRGITFGVFSWAGLVSEWRFRRFTGSGFRALTWEEAVADG